MFRTSEKYLTTTGIRSPILSERSFDIIMIKLPRIAKQQKSNLHLIKYGGTRKE